MMKFFRSFRFAWNGIRTVFSGQRNMKIILAAGVLATGWALFLRLTRLETAMVVLTCAMVFSLEMLNTAGEKLTDLACARRGKSPGAVKDILAGAVLSASIAAAVIGILILGKPTAEFFFRVFRR